jgi:hypothetical protein
MPFTTAAFRNWLKGGTNMKLSSNSAVNRITYEGITDFRSLLDFDRESIESLAKSCSKDIVAIEADEANNVAAEPAVAGANLSSISVRRLVVAMHAMKYYDSIGRAPTDANMHYNNVLSGFKSDYEAYVLLKKQDEPEVPLIQDKDKEKKVIKWSPLFEDALSRTFGSKGPLIYILRESIDVPNEDDDPLEANAHYGSSGSMIEELINRLPHTGPIYRDDNKTVFMMISKAATGTSVESTIKSFSRAKDGRGAYKALIANHAGDTKYRAIVKARMNLLQNIKWNGRSYPLEQHVSNHRTAVDDLRECSTHITVAVPSLEQRVEYLLESISCQDSALQAAMGNIRANTNNMREKFEDAASHLIEVDPYRRSTRQNQDQQRRAQVSAVTFAGRGTSGVDLRWHSRQEFCELNQQQKDELTTWQNSSDGKKEMRKQRNDFKKRKHEEANKTGNNGNNGNTENNSWRKKFKKALKTPKGLSHIMSVLREEETKNSGLISALQPSLPPAPAGNEAPAAPPAQPAAVSALASQFPAISTKVTLNSILKNSKQQQK